eukprot:1178432-Prorocentrum_minimum.AAC.2
MSSRVRISFRVRSTVVKGSRRPSCRWSTPLRLQSARCMQLYSSDTATQWYRDTAAQLQCDTEIQRYSGADIQWCVQSPCGADGDDKLSGVAVHPPHRPRVEPPVKRLVLVDQRGGQILRLAADGGGGVQRAHEVRLVQPRAKAAAHLAVQVLHRGLHKGKQVKHT